jgi:hypothetical protein
MPMRRRPWTPGAPPTLPGASSRLTAASIRRDFRVVQVNAPGGLAFVLTRHKNPNSAISVRTLAAEHGLGVESDAFKQLLRELASKPNDFGQMVGLHDRRSLVQRPDGWHVINSTDGAAEWAHHFGDVVVADLPALWQKKRLRYLTNRQALPADGRELRVEGRQIVGVLATHDLAYLVDGSPLQVHIPCAYGNVMRVAVLIEGPEGELCVIGTQVNRTSGNGSIFQVWPNAPRYFALSSERVVLLP